MRPTLGFLRRQSLRFRITLAFVLSAAVLSVAFGLATYYTVGSFLEDQRVRSATRQTVFGLLFAREFVTGRPERAEELVSLLKTRPRFDAMVISGDRWFSTTLALTPASLPAALESLIAEERLAYQIQPADQGRVIVFGAPLPPEGLDLYLFYSLEDVDQTLSLLARVLTVAGIIVLALAAGFAQRISGRILRPLRAVGEASERVAEGLLETRVETARRDEVGVLAASFNQMAEAFQRMIDRERRFVAGVSHELRTPLTALAATTELLAAHRESLPPPSREAVDLVSEDVQSLRRLVEELLEVSEIDSVKAPLRWEEVDLRAIVSAVLGRRRADAQIEGPAVQTYIDKTRFERIVGNLIDNAYRHGRGRDVRVSISASETACDIAISDRGPGIAPEDVPRLFERFYKADRSRTRERGGVGLGLAIALENAHLLGGTIEVAGAPGEGTTFTLRIPRRAAAAEAKDI